MMDTTPLLGSLNSSLNSDGHDGKESYRMTYVDDEHSTSVAGSIPGSQSDEGEDLPELMRSNTMSKKQLEELGIPTFAELLKANKATGTYTPLAEVRFSKLSYTETVRVNKGGKINTTGTAFKNLLCCLFQKKRFEERKILKNISGVIKPGTMTLVLGAPGSGKTSFLKALAGRLPKNKISGVMKINSKDAKDLRVENIFDYIGQEDCHLPLLRVEETLAFAERCQSQKGANSQIIDNIRKLRTNIIMKFLGIDKVRDTYVGNAMIRGVSGGQRKRVTIGEMLIGPKPIYLCDEISTGLDAATALEICTGLKNASEVFGTAFVIALLQPSPEIFNLFDDVLLLAEGQIAYHGPCSKVMGYFEGLGFTCPFFKDKCDFLQDICTRDGQKYAKQGSDHPRNAGEFVTRWKSSELYNAEKKNLQARWKYKLSDNLVTHLNKEFSSNWLSNTAAVMDRQWKLTLRDKEYTRRKMVQVLVIGLLLGSLNFQIEKATQQDALLVYSVFFFTSTFMALGGLPVVNSLLLERPVFYKQRQANFLRTSSYVFSMFVCSIPVDFLVTMTMSLIIYLMCGFYLDFQHFMIFFSTLFMLSVSLSALFRFLSSAMPDLTTAQPVMGASIILQTLFAGYIITSDKINNFWIWAYWFTPMSWGFRTLALNQFNSPDYDPEDADSYLQFMGVVNDESYILGGYLYMLIFTLVFYILMTLVLTYKHFEGHASAQKKEEDMDEDVDISGGVKVNVKRAPSLSLQALSFNPTTLSFHNLNYFVDHPKEKGAKLQLLRGVSGWATPGRMIALMGETGAGKTTLMDVIAGRKTGGIIEGKILFNGFELPKKKMARVLGYVEQMDIHSPTQTVREALMFSANLRLPRQVPQEARVNFVNQVLHLLELDVIADQMIGDVGSGLSLEQRKRLTCGVELVANPDVLFLDEPTSGLDSRAAQIVMRVIRNISATGRTVICTIHQPSQEIFFLFDDLLLLQAGGLVTYFNPLGKDCCQLIEYFESFEDSPRIERGINPADWMLQVLKKKERQRRNGGGGADFSGRYLESKMWKENKKLLKQYEQPQPDAKQIHPSEVLLAPTMVQIKVVFYKAWMHYWRTPSYSFTRILFFVGVSILYGTVFYQLPINYPLEQTSLQSLIGLIYSTTIFSGVAALQSVIPVLSDERVVYYRERAARTYDVVPYSWALTITELPYLMVSSFLFTVILYNLVGLRSGGFLFYWLVYFLYTVLQVFFGQLLAVAMPTAKIAAAIGAGFIMLWNLFCGFLVPVNKIPEVWIWMYWLSPTHYAIEALEVDQFYCDYYNIQNQCDVVEIYKDSETQTTLYVPKWAYVTSQYGFDQNNKWVDVWVLVGMIFACNFAKLFCLKYVSHLKR